jgi:predicted HicB family RNase H-like nuclease
MGEPKPLASLSGLLLARKGAARPAMRRPTTDGFHSNLAGNDDLGWNDMGYDVDPDQDTPMDHEHETGRNSLANAVPEVKPDVRAQQEMIARRLEAQAEVGFESVQSIGVYTELDDRETVQPPQSNAATPIAIVAPIAAQQSVQNKSVETILAAASQAQAPVRRAAKPRAASGSNGKAAFTLRLDPERHLKLRLACAVSNRSAQNLVTDALDALLDNMPEIGQLAARVPSNK